MDLAALEAKRDELEAQRYEAQQVLLRLQGAIAILRELIEAATDDETTDD